MNKTALRIVLVLLVIFLTAAQTAIVLASEVQHRDPSYKILGTRITADKKAANVQLQIVDAAGTKRICSYKIEGSTGIENREAFVLLKNSSRQCTPEYR